MKEINIGTIKFPLNSATRTFAVLAKRGAGKSYTAGVMAEEFYKAGIPFVVFDPIDVWWGLRLKEDGKSEGLPIVVFGNENADIKLDRDMGARIAQSIVKHNISCVISTFGMPKVAQRQLIQEFSEELLNINNTPRHIFIEEAHEFVPQRVFGAMGKVFAAVESLVVMGRNRGIGVTLINQRAATVNKDVLTQLDTLIALRNVSPQDRKALKEWVEYHSAEGDFEKFMKSLPTLPTGEAWVWSPEFLNVFKRIKVRARETFHPDREKLGANFEMPDLEQFDIQTFIDEFSSEKTESKEGVKSVPEVTEPTLSTQEVRNQYESQLIEKDAEIRRLQGVINAVQRAVGSTQEVGGEVQPVKSSNVAMWMQKLGNGGQAKILEFLASHPSDSFTRQQITLAIGAKYSSVKNVWIPLLKRNLLVKESGGRININPDL